VIAELAHELLPYAAGLYVFDSLVRVRQGDFAFLAAPGQRPRRRGPGWYPGGLLPTSEVFLADRTAAAGGDATADLAAIRARRAVQLRYRTPLMAASVCLFATVFVVLPAMVYRENAVPNAAEACLVIASVLWMAILALAGHALRTSGATRGATTLALAPAIFFPPAAAHVLSFLWRDSHRGFSPLAVAAVLLSRAEFLRSARYDLEVIEEAIRRNAGTPAEAEGQAGRTYILALLGSLGIQRGEITVGDAPQDAQAAVYCPLCETEYRTGFASCTDCEVPLRPFAASPGPSGSPATR
jgi:hypothetical protein